MFTGTSLPGTCDYLTLVYIEVAKKVYVGNWEKQNFLSSLFFSSETSFTVFYNYVVNTFIVNINMKYKK